MVKNQKFRRIKVPLPCEDVSWSKEWESTTEENYVGVVWYWITIRDRKTFQKVVFHNGHRWREGHSKGGTGTWDLHRRNQEVIDDIIVNNEILVHLYFLLFAQVDMHAS